MERFILISTCNRETEIKCYENIVDAYDEMDNNYNEALSEYTRDYREYVNQTVPGGIFDFGIDRLYAWITDTHNNDYYDWSIHKIIL